MGNEKHFGFITGTYLRNQPGEGRFRAAIDREGKEYTTDYADLLNGLILAERKVVLNLDRKPGFHDKVKAAEAQKDTTAPQKQPEMEHARV